MVAQMILDHLVWVRALVPEPNGPMVKWLRRCPLKAESGVQFPLGLPLKAKPHSIIECGFFIFIKKYQSPNKKTLGEQPRVLMTILKVASLC